jgi:hypothetical protein
LKDLILAGEGLAHFTIFKNIVPFNVKSRDRIEVIWFTVVSLIWKARNEMIFNQAGFEWENVLEEAKILSWRILRARSKGFSCDLSMWRQNPLSCNGTI